MSDQQKTECPFCGLVWQEHTINETQGCMAILQMQCSAAKARDAELKGKPIPSLTEDYVCPVCDMLTSEHSYDDHLSCVAKWRKREEGSTGLEFQGIFTPSGVTTPSQAHLLQMACSCGKANGDHTPDEIIACIDRRQKG